MTKTELAEMYEARGMSTTDIAQELDTTANSVARTLAKHAIRLRSRTQGMKAKNSPRTPDCFPSLYQDSALTISEVAGRLGVSAATVHNWRKRLDLEPRSNSARRGGNRSSLA